MIASDISSNISSLLLLLFFFQRQAFSVSLYFSLFMGLSHFTQSLSCSFSFLLPVAFLGRLSLQRSRSQAAFLRGCARTASFSRNFSPAFAGFSSASQQ